MSVNIAGLDKVMLLEHMWQNTYPRGRGMLQGLLPFNRAQASTAVTGYIDYFQGRPIKSDISGDEVDPYLYDRDSSLPLAKIVERLRSSK